MTADGEGGVRCGVSMGKGGEPGAGNVDADPLFVDPSNGNYHCEPGMPDTDHPDGVNPIVDKGAYEFQGATETIPTVSEWGMYTMTLFMLTAGTIALGRRGVAYRS